MAALRRRNQQSVGTGKNGNRKNKPSENQESDGVAGESGNLTSNRAGVLGREMPVGARRERSVRHIRTGLKSALFGIGPPMRDG